MVTAVATPSAADPTIYIDPNDFEANRQQAPNGLQSDDALKECSIHTPVYDRL
jgi:hypothetical protein